MAQRTFTMTHALVAARRKVQKAFNAAFESKRDFNTILIDTPDYYYAYDVLHREARRHPYASAWHGEFSAYES